MQVQIGSHSFTFDHVYGSSASPSSQMYEECAAPLVDGLFQGYNATVLAYGQVVINTQFSVWPLTLYACLTSLPGRRVLVKHTQWVLAAETAAKTESSLKL